VYVPLVYFVTSVCSIRVVQQSSVQCINHLSEQIHLPENFLVQLAQRCSDNGGPTATLYCIVAWTLFLSTSTLSGLGESKYAGNF